jgi:hypothetical protein
MRKWLKFLRKAWKDMRRRLDWAALIQKTRRGLSTKGNIELLVLAKDSFYADLKLSEPKFQTALYKTLAIVGSIAQKVSPEWSKCAFRILLPYGEYEDRKLYEQMITDAIAGFRFRGEEKF